MKLKRILSFTLALCLCMAMLPAVTAQADETDNITICGVDIGVKAGTHMQYSNSNGALAENGYYYNGVNLLSTQCLGFARWCQYKMFGYHRATDGDKFYYVTVNGVYRVYPGDLTASTIKALVLASKPGAHLRTYSSGHSMIITEITETGFSVVECNGGNENNYSNWGQNYIGTCTYTWDSYVKSTYGKRGIEFIELPYEYPYDKDHTEHRFTGNYYDSEHPHKVYTRCYCGERQYTEETTTDVNCAVCYPMDSSYDAVLPFKAYLKDSVKAFPYTTPWMENLSGGEIWPEDECTISAVYANGVCQVRYPAGTSYQTAYLPLSVFLENPYVTQGTQQVTHRILTYARNSTAYGSMYGYTGAGDEIYTLGSSGKMTQIFYHTASGYKLAWVLTAELQEATYDQQFAGYGAMYGYPCAEANFLAYEADRTTRSGEIYTTDDCVIHAVYADGWCLVTYPVPSGTRTGYALFSNFARPTDSSCVKYFAQEQMVAYTNQTFSETVGTLQAGMAFYVVSTNAGATQILYQRQDAGYQLAWIDHWTPSATVLHQYTVNDEEVIVYYQNLTEALAFADRGTVVLLADAAIGTAFISPNVTLDLNGHVLMAYTLVVMNGATITDGGANCVGGGLLQIGKDNLIFARNNGQNIIPVWNGTEGYVFTKVIFQQLARPAEGAAQYIFLPNFSNAQVSALLADGSSDNGIRIQVCLAWNQGQSLQYYTYSDDLVEKVYDGTGQWVFNLKVTGIAALADITASPVVITDSGALATTDNISLVTGT